MLSRLFQALKFYNQWSNNEQQTDQQQTEQQTDQTDQPTNQTTFLWPNSQSLDVTFFEQWEESNYSREVPNIKQITIRNSTFLPLSKRDLKAKYK